MKHICIKLKFVHNAVKENNIKIQYIPLNIEIADLFTKTLLKVKFYELFCFYCLYKEY